MNHRANRKILPLVAALMALALIFSACSAPGPAGKNGATGPIGAIGVTGPAGATGTIGVTGPTGAVGPQGPAGVDGIDGSNGAKGSTGATGATGPTGPQGPAGSTGAKGDAGIKGDTGAVGPTGATGLPGAVSSAYAYAYLKGTGSSTFQIYQGITFSNNTASGVTITADEISGSTVFNIEESGDYQVNYMVNHTTGSGVRFYVKVHSASRGTQVAQGTQVVLAGSGSSCSTSVLSLGAGDTLQLVGTANDDFALGTDSDNVEIQFSVIKLS